MGEPQARGIGLSLVKQGGLDAAMTDLGILRRCMHRIHQFSPGVQGRELLQGGDRCASLGHWSLILEQHVDVSSVSLSCLISACRVGRVDAIESLVSHYGLDVNGEDSGGWTPLHIAMVHGGEGVVRCLLEVGAEDSATTNDGVHVSSLRPDLWYRVAGEEVAVKTDAWEAPDTCGEAVTQVVGMIEEGTVSTEVLCCRVCAAVSKLGTSVLEEVDAEARRIGEWRTHWAVIAATASSGRYSMCRVCVELGAAVDEPKNCGLTPLWIACQKGHVDCARLLVERGADVNKPKDCDVTPLWITCQNGHLDCARLLMDSGAAVDKADIDGWTPLHRACAWNRRHVTALLLERGADPMKPDKIGRASATWALSGVTADSELVEAMELAMIDSLAAIERLWTMDASGSGQ